jgi:hypothetical protein
VIATLALTFSKHHAPDSKRCSPERAMRPSRATPRHEQTSPRDHSKRTLLSNPCNEMARRFSILHHAFIDRLWLGARTVSNHFDTCPIWTEAIFIGDRPTINSRHPQKESLLGDFPTKQAVRSESATYSRQIMEGAPASAKASRTLVPARRLSSCNDRPCISPTAPSCSCRMSGRKPSNSRHPEVFAS